MNKKMLKIFCVSEKSLQRCLRSAGIISVPLTQRQQPKPISYAYDIRIFFQFLLDENPAFKNYKMTDFTVDVLDQIKALDLEEYQEYLKVYQAGDKTETNGERGLKRKISALRSFYAYFYKREMIETNPTVLIDVPQNP